MSKVSDNEIQPKNADTNEKKEEQIINHSNNPNFPSVKIISKKTSSLKDGHISSDILESQFHSTDNSDFYCNFACKSVTMDSSNNTNNSKFDLIYKLVDEGHISPDKFNTENESLLGIACSTGHYNLAQLLIQKGADVNRVGANGEHTPLMEAINSGSIRIANLLINHKANVNAKSKSGYTALHIACASGSLPCTKLLIEAGADPTICSALLRTPVMEAAFCGYSEIIAYLLDKSPKTINSSEYISNTNPNTMILQNHYMNHNSHTCGNNNDNFLKICHINFRESPLLIASHRGHADAVRVILERMSYMVNPEEDIMSSILEATIDCHVHVVKILLEFASQHFEIDEALNSPLTLAASGGHIGLVKLFVDYGANPSDFNAEGFTPLMEACREGHLDVIRYFLSSEVVLDVNTITKEHGETALTIACCSGNFEVVKYLIEVGNASLELGHSSPLIEASSENHPEIVEYLLQKGASINSKGTVGRTALYHACEVGNFEVVKILVDHGCQIDTFCDDGKTPLMRAVESGHLDIVDYLISKGANVNLKASDDDWSALAIACVSGNVIMARLLVANGADPFIYFNDNSNLLIEASRAGHMNIVSFLLNPSSSIPCVKSILDCKNCSSFVSNNTLETSMKPTLPLHICDISEIERLKSLIPPRILDYYMKTNKITDKNIACNSIASAFHAYSQKMFESNKHTDNILPNFMNASNCNAKKFFAHNLQDQSPCTLANSNVRCTTFQEGTKKHFRTIITTNNNKNSIKKPTRMCEYHNLVESMCAVDWNNLPNELLSLGNYIENGICNDHFLNDNNTECSFSDSGNAVHRYNISLLNLLENLSLKGSKLANPLSNSNKECQPLFSQSTSKLTISSNMNHPSLPSSTNNFCHHSVYNEFLSPNDTISAISDEYLNIILNKINNFFKDNNKPYYDVNHKTDSNKDTSLMVACCHGHLDIVQYLLKNNADPLHIDRRGYSILMGAAASGHLNVVRLILSLNKVDINHKSERTQECALTLATSIGHCDIIEALLDHGANIEQRNNNDYTPLCLAAHNGYLNALQLLLRRKANVNARGIYTPLMLAVMNGHYECVEQLILYGADVNICIESNGSTALSLAVYSNKIDLVLLLLKHGALIDCKNKGGFTPFMDAVSSNNVKIGKIMLDHHYGSIISTNPTNNNMNSAGVTLCRDSAMLLSAEKGHYEFLELLLQRKFPVDCRNKKGQTPSWLSATNGFLNCLILLYEHKANIELADYAGITPLFSAFRNCQCEVVEWLASKVDQLPSLNLCRKYMLKCSSDVKSKFEHAYNILSRAIHRKSQIAEMNANRLLLEEERGKNKKKKKRKAKKSTATSSSNTKTTNKDNDDGNNNNNNINKDISIINANKSIINFDDEDDDDDDDDNHSPTIVSNIIKEKKSTINDQKNDSLKNTIDNSSQGCSVTLSDDSDSEGWITTQQTSSQQHTSPSLNIISTTNQQPIQVSKLASSFQSKKIAKPIRNMPDLSESVTEITFVNRACVSKTIGRNGSTISAIKNKTVTFIDIDTVTEIDGGRICKTLVIGKKQGVEEAIRLLKSIETNPAAVMEELAPYLGDYAQYLNLSTNNSLTQSNNLTHKNLLYDSIPNTTTHQTKKTPQSPNISSRNLSYKLPAEHVIVAANGSVSNEVSNEKSKKIKSCMNNNNNSSNNNDYPFRFNSHTNDHKNLYSPSSHPASSGNVTKVVSSSLPRDSKTKSIEQIKKQYSIDNITSPHRPFTKTMSTVSGNRGNDDYDDDDDATITTSINSNIDKDVDISDSDEVSWFPLLKSSEFLSYSDSTIINTTEDNSIDSSYDDHDHDDNNCNTVTNGHHCYEYDSDIGENRTNNFSIDYHNIILPFLKKNTFPQSLRQSTCILPTNDVALLTLTQNRCYSNLIPGIGRNFAPLSKLKDMENVYDLKSILQYAHERFPSFVNALDQETLLRVTNAISKEVTSINYDTYNDISASKDNNNNNNNNNDSGDHVKKREHLKDSKTKNSPNTIIVNTPINNNNNSRAALSTLVTSGSSNSTSTCNLDSKWSNNQSISHLSTTNYFNQNNPISSASSSKLCSNNLNEMLPHPFAPNKFHSSPYVAATSRIANIPLNTSNNIRFNSVVIPPLALSPHTNSSSNTTASVTLNTNNNNNKNDNSNIYKSSSVPISPMIPGYRVCLPHSNVIVSSPAHFIPRFSNFCRPVGFIDPRNNTQSSSLVYSSINDNTNSNGSSNVEFYHTDNSVSNITNANNFRNSILVFCERYNLMDLFNCLKDSLSSFDDLFVMNDSQFLDINVPIRYIQTLRLAINDFVQNNSSYFNNKNSSPRNSRSYNFYHSEYKS